VKDGALWRLWYTSAPEGMQAEIDRRLGLRDTASVAPLAVIDMVSGKSVGMTTFMNIDDAAHRVEIGSTWRRRSAQRSPTNTECKLLLLRHGFESLD
jgi:RimJ/RimL family protein N-acetyltransferase